MIKASVGVLLVLCISAVLASRPLAKRDVGDNIQEGLDNIGQYAKNASSAIKEGAHTAGEKLQEGAQTVKEGAQDLAHKAQEAGSNALDKIGEGMENLGEKMQGTFGGHGNAVTSSLTVLILPVLTLLLKMAIFE